jgi:N-acetylglutamate synthase-like GNAT family acetyltransferase
LGSKTKSRRALILQRKYVQGDEIEIVNLLNLCFENWGNVEKWRHRYLRYPTFTNEDVVIVEHDGQIVGHGGIHMRDFVFKNLCKVPAALLGDVAVHPRYRREGIYSRVIKPRERARARGASLTFAWYSKNSITYKAGIKDGCIEVKQPFLYMKLLRPERIMARKLKNLLDKNEKFMKVFQESGIGVSFRFGSKETRLKDLGEISIVEKGHIQIILSEEALASMVHFMRASGLHRAIIVLCLLLSRRVKVRSSSLSILAKLIIKGISIIKAL